MSRSRAWAELLRLPALFTVPGDALSGAVAAGGRPTPRTLLAIGSSLCLYEAGMALNDWADRVEDAAERPHRPLPSGRIRPAAAFTAACALTAAGLGLAAGAGRPALAVAGPLAATVWAYDLGLKHTPAGPVAMAAARGLDHLLGAAATTGRPRTALTSAALLGTHTLAVTAVSRRETQGGTSLPPLAALAATALLTGLLTRPAHGEDTASPPADPDGRAAPDRAGRTPGGTLPAAVGRGTPRRGRPAPEPGRPRPTRAPVPGSSGFDPAGPPPDRASPAAPSAGAGRGPYGRSGLAPARRPWWARAPVSRSSGYDPAGPPPDRASPAAPSAGPGRGPYGRSGLAPARRPWWAGAPGSWPPQPRAAPAPTRVTGPGAPPYDRPGRSTPDLALRAALATAYAATAGRPYAHAALNPSPPLTQRAVGGGIRATIPLQAALAARAGSGLTALAIAALAPLGRKYARKVSIT